MKKLLWYLFMSVVLITACCKKNEMPAIGDKYQGGIVFYIDEAQGFGLIIAEHRLPLQYSWSLVNGETGAHYGLIGISGEDNEPGTGYKNTPLIINFPGSGNCAAKACDELVLQGYDDWYLPSHIELTLAKDYFNEAELSAVYWSSTENFHNKANANTSNTGGADGTPNYLGFSKITQYWVYPIRKFLLN